MKNGFGKAGLFFALVLGLLTMTPLGVWAQPEAESDQPPGQTYYDQAREAYRAQQYNDAAWLLRQAIQAEPLGARYYIGLARAYYYLEQFDQAVYFYDLYLTHFADHAREARRRADREPAIRRERDEANARRTTPETPPGLPSDQQAALAAFQERLGLGTMMNLEHTGAYSFYQTLLRTGYAHPQLQQLKETLIDGILAEAHACFSPTSTSPVPVATLEQWQLVHQRYRVVEELGRDLTSVTEVDARGLAAQGQIDLINSNYDRAAERFQNAITLDPNLLSARWGLLYALHKRAVYQDHPLDNSVLALIEDLDRLTEIQAPQHAPLVTLARSILLADMGRSEEAAAILIELLAPGHSSTSGAASLPPTEGPSQTEEDLSGQSEPGPVSGEGPQNDGKPPAEQSPLDTPVPGTPPPEL